MGTIAAGVALAVGAETVIRSFKHLQHGTAFSPVTFLGGVCFLAAIANYVNKPTLANMQFRLPDSQRYLVWSGFVYSLVDDVYS